MFCFHKYGNIQKDGYQYCSKCGVAKSAPAKVCSHKFHTVKVVEVLYFGNVVGEHRVCECARCGVVQVYKIGEA